MLMVVRDNETRAELEARRREQEETVAAIASAPVQHVPVAFLAAVEGLFPELVAPAKARQALPQ
jgi:hypothetical protein